jgi:hypothetical protein
MRVVGAVMMVLALVSGILPQFTDCASQGRQLTLQDGRQIPMKCTWTARAEAAVAAPLLATGLFMALSRRKEMLRVLGAIGIILGAAVILLPTSLIGVCGNPAMICHSLMKPALTLTGSVTIALGIVAVVFSMIGVRSVSAAELLEGKSGAA